MLDSVMLCVAAFMGICIFYATFLGLTTDWKDLERRRLEHNAAARVEIAEKTKRVEAAQARLDAAIERGDRLRAEFNASKAAAAAASARYEESLARAEAFDK